MANETINQFTEQFEKSVFGPMRDFLATATDHAEKIAGMQIEAAKAYTDISFKNAREILEIRDTEALKNYVGKQPEVVKEFSERVKADAEKVTAANQDFVEKAQKVTQDSVAEVQKAAEEGVEKVQKTAGAK